MKKAWALLLLTGSLHTVFAQKRMVNGSWTGKAGGQIPLVFHFERTKNGQLGGSLDSPAQGQTNIGLSSVELLGDSLIVRIDAANVVYTASWQNDSTLAGTWKQGATEVALTIQKTKGGTIRQRSQTPVPPFPYTAEEVAFDNADHSIHFSGSFTRPKQAGRFVTALLITGSGQQDRDETIFGHKPFAVIADYLTRKGYAVLRVDDRGMGKTTGQVDQATTADFAADAEAAIAYLKTRKEVNPRKTGIIGHSEGGLIAAMLAARDPSLSFVVLLAAPGVNGRTLTANQVASILQANGRTPAAVTAYQQLYRSLMDIAVAEKDSASTFHEGFAAYQLWKQQTPETVQKELFLGNDTLARRDVWKNLYTFRVPWFRYFMQAEPAQYLEKLQCSVLALNGEKDIQVNADENLAAIEQALKKSRARSFDIQKLPGLNHLFQHCTTCTTAEYMQLEETFSPGALAVMGNWLDRTIKNNP
jgi:pimeloyl-ACP methyl ester carboxylesterase